MTQIQENVKRGENSASRGKLKYADKFFSFVSLYVDATCLTINVLFVIILSAETMSNPNAKPDFSWMYNYTEIAKKLLKKYANNQQGLLDLLKNIHNSGIPFFTGEPDHLTNSPIDKIDPFSFFILFNHLEIPKRKQFIQTIQRDLGIKVNLPNDFAGANLEIQCWSFRYIKKILNAADAKMIEKLWDMASQAVDLSNFNDKLFMACKGGIKGISHGYLTTGLYLLRPDCFIPWSKPINKYLYQKKLRLQSSFTCNKYRNDLQKISPKIPSKEFVVLMYAAFGK